MSKFDSVNLEPQSQEMTSNNILEIPNLIEDYFQRDEDLGTISNLSNKKESDSLLKLEIVERLQARLDSLKQAKWYVKFFLRDSKEKAVQLQILLERIQNHGEQAPKSLRKLIIQWEEEILPKENDLNELKNPMNNKELMGLSRNKLFKPYRSLPTESQKVLGEIKDSLAALEQSGAIGESKIVL